MSEPPTTLLAYAGPTTNCNGFMQASSPEICPSKTLTQQLGQHPAQHWLMRGAGAIPWVVSLEGDAHRDCSRVSSNVCIETITCDCFQQSSVGFSSSSLDLHVRSVDALPRSASVAIGAGESAALAVDERSGGELAVVVSSPEYGARGASQTRLRYFVVATQ